VDAAPARACRSATAVERLLRHPDLEVLGVSATPGGLHGAKVLTLAVPTENGRVVLRAKWRAHQTAGLTNDPRKELAAYAVQKLFLEPHEYVVPPAVGRCFELDAYRRSVDAAAVASFDGIDCVFGYLSYWLEGVEDLEDALEDGWLDGESMLDGELFANNPLYRRSLADVNLFTYLIHHGDAHDEQFVLTLERHALHVYSVDNSIAFESFKNPMVLLFREDWSRIKVPALRRQPIERLRRLDRRAVSQLALIEQFENRAGLLIPEPPTPPVGRTDAGLRWLGDELKVGLTAHEIDGIWRRWRELLAQIEAGGIQVF